MALIPRLLQTHTLTFERTGTDGYYNDYGEWVEGTPSAPFPVKGSLQPFKMGRSQQDLPSGITAKDARLFYTVEDLQVGDEYTNSEPDTTEIDGIPFEAYHSAPWVGYGMQTEHYQVVLVRRDKMNVA